MIQTDFTDRANELRVPEVITEKNLCLISDEDFSDLGDNTDEMREYLEEINVHSLVRNSNGRLVMCIREQNDIFIKFYERFNGIYGSDMVDCFSVWVDVTGLTHKYALESLGSNITRKLESDLSKRVGENYAKSLNKKEIIQDTLDLFVDSNEL